MRWIFSLCFVAACSGSPSVSGAFSALESDCAVPAAIPDDGLDDRAAIQEALDTQKCAYLPLGVYDVDTPSFVSPARRIYAMITVDGSKLYGEGPRTELRFRGNAQGQDWQGVHLQGEGPEVHDLLVNTAALTGTSEQTHALHTRGPTANLSVRRVSFHHPQRGEPGGDCFQIVGYAPNQLVVNSTVRDNDFAHCDRSGVAIHSGAQGLQITDNRFSDTGDQDIDGEGTGDSADWLITRNLISLGSAPQGDTAIQIQATSRARIESNVIRGRGLFLYGCSDCEVSGNLVQKTSLGALAVIEIRKGSVGVSVNNNTLIREASAGPGSMVRAVPQGTLTPSAIVVSHNVLTQRAPGHIVETSGVVGLTVESNSTAYSGTLVGALGVNATGSSGTYAIRTDDIHVNRNVFQGPLRAAIGVSGSYAGTGSVSATGNVASTTGLLCTNIASGGMVLGPMDVRGNSWRQSVCGTWVEAGN